MGFMNFIKNFLTYQGPEEYEQFELLEDESENHDQTRPTRGLRRLFSHWLPKRRDPGGEGRQIKADDEVVKKLSSNLERIKNEFNYPTNHDLVVREFQILQQTSAFIAYIEGITKEEAINNYILRQLLSPEKPQAEIKRELPDFVVNNLLAVEQVTKECRYTQIIRRILEGKTALFMDGYAECILIETTRFEKRALQTPLTEMVVEGPQEAFIEDLRTNITLIRKTLRNKNLVTELLNVNKENHITCGLLYVKNICNPEIIREIKRRIEHIDIDFFVDGMLTHLIEDHPYALLPQILNTERPDRVAALLMEGRAALVLEGTPFVSIVPMTFAHFLHTSEDFYLRWQYGTFLRLIRLLAAFFAVFLPGLYLALTLYHHEAIPVGLLTTIIRTREHLPFPAPIELLIMELSWELIREAGVRVPGVVGQTLGIIGGVILGQAAVAAGLVSPILIVVVAITGLGNFAIPDFPIGFGLRILRFAFFALGWLAGLYGIAIGILAFGGFACSMKSFGVPFFSPLSPKTKGSSILLRKPIFLQKEKPDAINPLIKEKTKSMMRGWAGADEGGDSK